MVQPSYLVYLTCFHLKVKALSTKENMTEDKPTKNWYNKKPNHKNKNQFRSFLPNGSNLPFKKELVLCCGKPCYHSP